MGEPEQEPIDAVSSYKKEIASNKELTPAEEEKEIGKAKKGDAKATSALAESFARRAMEIALFRYDGSIPPMRLIQEANRSLYYALAHLDSIPPETSFSSYATTLINARLDRFIEGEKEAMDSLADDDFEEKKDEIALPGQVSSSNSVGLFFAEVGKYPLLTQSEELSLGRTIQKGRMENASEEEKEQGKLAVQRMVNCNLRLVANMAKNYLNRGVPYLDLVQEGCIGLQRAAEKFDPSLGNRFSTYATCWIAQAFQKALCEQGRPIKIPNHMVARISKVQKVFAKLSSELGRDPDLSELSEELPDYDEKDLAAIMEIPTMVSSLNAPINDEESDSPDLLSSQKGDDDIEDGLEKEDESALVEMGLKHLNDRERTIVSYLYGLDGKEELDMAEIGRRFNLSRERIRQIKEAALRKMKIALQSEIDEAKR